MDGYSNPHLDLSTDYLAQDPDTTMKEAAKLDFAIDDDNNDDDVFIAICAQACHPL